MIKTTPGIVLRETSYKDADKILTVLTQDLGKCAIKARGCRRKNSKLAAVAQLLVYSELTVFEQRDFYTLNEASTLEQFWGIRQDFSLLALASYFAQVLDVTVQEGTPHPELLSLLLNSLYAIDKLGKPPALIKAVFELRLMALLGYEPLLHECAVCGTVEPKQPQLHLTAGMLHCASCRAQLGDGISMPLTSAALSAMRYILWGEAKRLFSFTIDKESLRLLGNTTEAFLLTQLERGFHTLDFYKHQKGQTLV